MSNSQSNHNGNGYRPQAPETDLKELLNQTAVLDPSPESVIPPLPPPVSTSVENAEWEKTLLSLTNAERSKENLPPLNHNPLLAKAAQGHAEDMASHNFCDHKGSDGSKIKERVQAVGYPYSCIGENVAAGSKTPEEVVEGWMNSPKHRANILNPDFTEIGFGYAYNPLFTYHHYWVQNLGSQNGDITSKTVTDKPDFWNYALVTVLTIFYLASLTSTYISTHLLLSLLSGGVGITIPIFGMEIAITDAVSFMGSGILEGAALSDAYLEHKQNLSGSRKWASRGGRFLAFIGQGLLYYMALGQLLFATADVSSLGAQGFENPETPRTEATLILNPPTVLHGAFVGTISFAWSYGTTYMTTDALLVAISSLRCRRKSQNSPISRREGLGDGAKKAASTDVGPLLKYLFTQLAQRLEVQKREEKMKYLADELKRLQRDIDENGVNNSVKIPEEIRRDCLEILRTAPEVVLEKSGFTRDQAAAFFKQSSQEEGVKSAANPPKNWWKKG